MAQVGYATKTGAVRRSVKVWALDKMAKAAGLTVNLNGMASQCGYTSLGQLTYP